MSKFSFSICLATAGAAFALGYYVRGNGTASEASSSSKAHGIPVEKAGIVTKKVDVPSLELNLVGEDGTELSTLIAGDASTREGMARICSRIVDFKDKRLRDLAIEIMLAKMTPENAWGPFDAMVDITKKTGKTPEGWESMMRRQGEVLGAEALLRFPNEASWVFEGWGSKDAISSFNHLKTLPEADQKRLMGSWMQGAALNNPEEVLARAIEAKSANFDQTTVMRQIIQAGGIERAQSMLQNAIDNAPDDVTQNRAFLSLFDGLTRALFHQTWTSERPEQTANWIEQIKDEPYLSSSHIHHAAFNYLAKGNPNDAVAWVKRMASSGKGQAGLQGLQSAARGYPQKFQQLPPEVQEAVMAGILP